MRFHISTDIVILIATSSYAVDVQVFNTDIDIPSRCPKQKLQGSVWELSFQARKVCMLTSLATYVALFLYLLKTSKNLFQTLGTEWRKAEELCVEFLDTHVCRQSTMF